MGGVCSQQSHWGVRPVYAYKLAVPGIPVGGAWLGHTGDRGLSPCAGACLRAVRARGRVSAGALDLGLRPPGCPVGADAPGCAHVLALRVATCAGAAVAATPSQDLAPERTRGQGPPPPGGSQRDVVGAVLVLAVAALMGEAPGSGAGVGWGWWNKEGESELQRRRKRPGMRRALGSRGTGQPESPGHGLGRGTCLAAYGLPLPPPTVDGDRGFEDPGLLCLPEPWPQPKAPTYGIQQNRRLQPPRSKRSKVTFGLEGMAHTSSGEGRQREPFYARGQEAPSPVSWLGCLEPQFFPSGEWEGNSHGGGLEGGVSDG